MFNNNLNNLASLVFSSINYVLFSDGTYVKRLGPEYSYLELQDIMEDEDEMPMGEGPGKKSSIICNHTCEKVPHLKFIFPIKFPPTLNYFLFISSMHFTALFFQNIHTQNFTITNRF